MAWNLLKDIPGSMGTSLPEIVNNMKTLWENVKRLNQLFQPANYSSLIPFGKTLADMIASMGAASSTLYINSVVTVSANLTIPSNISVVVLKGGGFAIATGVTLTMPVPQAGEYTIFTFTGTGIVVFSKGRYAVWDWFGADPTGVTSSQAAHDKMLLACVNIKSFCIPIGSYHVTGLNWRGLQGWKIFGYGQTSAIIGAAAGGTYVVNLGDPDHDDEAADAANATRDCTFSDFLVTAIGSYTYGLNSDWCVASRFDRVEVASDTFAQAMRWDFSWGNTWISGSAQGQNAFELGDNNVNQNTFQGTRFRCNGSEIEAEFTADTGTSEIVFASVHGRSSGYKIEVITTGTLPGSGNLALHTVYWLYVTSTTRARLTRTYADALAGTNLITIGSAGIGTHTAIGAPFGVVVKGQDNSFYTCDSSNALHGFVMGRTRGATFDGCYSEPRDSEHSTVFSFGQLQAVSDCVNIRGTYILGGGAYYGINCIGGQGHNALVVQGNYFRNVVYGIGNPTNFVNPQFGPNYFEIYQTLTLSAGGYTNCVAGDVGKSVVSGSDYGGVLQSFDNTTREWVVLTTTLFPLGAVTITSGTGAGTVTGIIGDRYTRPLAHDHCFQDPEYRQEYNSRRFTVNVGSVAGPADTILASVYKLTHDRPAVVRIRLVGRDSSSANKEIRATVSIDDGGAVESWSAETTTPTGAAALTGFDVSSGNLRALGLETSNWNAILESAIWED